MTLSNVYANEVFILLSCSLLGEYDCLLGALKGESKNCLAHIGTVVSHLLARSRVTPAQEWRSAVTLQAVAKAGAAKFAKTGTAELAKTGATELAEGGAMEHSWLGKGWGALLLLVRGSQHESCNGE